MSGEQVAATPMHTRANSWLHLAGIPPQFLVTSEAPLTTGFTGCMQDLKVNFTSFVFNSWKIKYSSYRKQKMLCMNCVPKENMPLSPYFIH
jgi:hypothetical protein